MTNNKRVINANPLDVPKVERAQARCLRAYKRHLKNGGWRAVGKEFGVNHVYAYDLALFGKVPSNPDVRVKLGLPRVMPSERKQSRSAKARVEKPKIWQRPDLYLK